MCCTHMLVCVAVVDEICMWLGTLFSLLVSHFHVCFCCSAFFVLFLFLFLFLVHIINLKRVYVYVKVGKCMQLCHWHTHTHSYMCLYRKRWGQTLWYSKPIQVQRFHLVRPLFRSLSWSLSPSLSLSLPHTVFPQLQCEHWGNFDVFAHQANSECAPWAHVNVKLRHF